MIVVRAKPTGPAFGRPMTGSLRAGTTQVPIPALTSAPSAVKEPLPTRGLLSAQLEIRLECELNN
jgi:hypothetical protein